MRPQQDEPIPLRMLGLTRRLSLESGKQAKGKNEQR